MGDMQRTTCMFLRHWSMKNSNVSCVHHFVFRVWGWRSRVEEKSRTCRGREDTEGQGLRLRVGRQGENEKKKFGRDREGFETVGVMHGVGWESCGGQTVGVMPRPAARAFVDTASKIVIT